LTKEGRKIWLFSIEVPIQIGKPIGGTDEKAPQRGDYRDDDDISVLRHSLR